MSAGMQIIPAIDLNGGKCVRLLQGRDEATTEYSSDPVAMAEEWVRQGAKRLHVVNLDGAFGRASGHLEILRRITDRVDAIVEYGGGLRTPEDVEEALDAGCHKVVLGTMAVEQRSFLRTVISLHGAECIIVALDSKEGKVTTRGWRDATELTVGQAAREMQKEGVGEVLHTDVARDGMMTGPDLETLRNLCDTDLNVIASGGVASPEDVRRLVGLGSQNLIGVVVGKALYDRKVTLQDLLNAAGESEKE